MQKSRSSTNVQQGFMSKRIWKGRSKSQTRTNTVASPWTPLVSISIILLEQNMLCNIFPIK